MMHDHAEKWDNVMKALYELNEAYYRTTSDVAQQRADVERALQRLMIAYNAWLG